MRIRLDAEDMRFLQRELIGSLEDKNNSGPDLLLYRADAHCLLDRFHRALCSAGEISEVDNIRDEATEK